MSLLLSSPNEKMYPKAGREVPGTESHFTGESCAQPKGTLLVLKFPLFAGSSVAAHIAPAYRSPYKYLKFSD